MEVQRSRILLVESAPRVTGSVRSLSSAIHQLRDEFDFALAGGSAEVRDAVGVRWYPFSFAQPRRAELLTYGPRVWWQARQFRRLTEEARIDLVHVNDLTNLVPLVARRLGARFRLVYHVRLLPDSYIGPVFKPLSRLVLWNADRVLCVSQAVMDALPRSWRVALVPNGLPISVVPDGVVVKPLPPREPRRRPTIEVLVVSHFHPGKGHELAVRAFAVARREVPELRLTFVGDESVSPAHAASVRREVAERGLSDVVHFAGAEPEPSARMHDADIVLHLSESESFSMVVLEAMMQGRAIIASACGGPQELLAEPETGIVVPNRDVDAAGRALVSLARDEQRRARLGERAREVAVRRYDVTQTARALSAVYREVLALNELRPGA